MNDYRFAYFAFLFVLAMFAAPLTAIAGERKVELRDGTSLYVGSSGAMRMEDATGEPFPMKDNVVMETADGELLLMKNKRLWKRHRHKAPATRRPAIDSANEEVIRLKDGSFLVSDEKGGMRMQDRDGKPIAMPDDVEMETEDGEIILMRNKALWRLFGD